MSRRGTALAWGLFAATVVFFAAGASLGLSRPPMEGVEIGATDLLFVASFLAFPLVGAFIATHRGDNPIGWILLGGSCAFMAGIAIAEYALHAIAVEPGTLPAGTLAAWVSEWLPAAGAFTLLPFTLLLFPDGKLPSPRWRRFVYVALGLMAGAFGAVMLKPGPLNSVEGAVGNPLGIEGAEFLRSIADGGLALAIPIVGASVVSVFLRYRRAGAETRLQIKWLAYAGLLLPVVFGMWILEDLGAAPPKPAVDAVSLVAFWALPAAIGIAILRYRLYDIDVVINRTLVYGLLTVVLVGAYVGAVAGIGAVARAFTGQESNSLVIVVSTLAVAALFRPLRARLQTFIDRRFYRQRYDATATLDRFSARLRDQVDLESLRNEVVLVVGTTMQPAHASLWLRPREEAEVGEAAG